MTSCWKKKKLKEKKLQQLNPKQNQVEGAQENSECSQSSSQPLAGATHIQQPVNRRKVNGFIEEETLWKLQKCLVGYSAMESDSNRIHERLYFWGLGEITVKRLADRVFLLEVNDDALYSSLKEARWSYLLEIFTEVHPWSDSFKIPERVVWVELVGTPLHCWNPHTFKQIAEIWGELIFLGENASQLHGVVNAKRWADVVYKNPSGPKNQIDKALSQIRGQHTDVVIEGENFNNCNGPKNQEVDALDFEGARSSPLVFDSWAKSIDLVNNTLILSPNREGTPNSQSEEERAVTVVEFTYDDPFPNRYIKRRNCKSGDEESVVEYRRDRYRYQKVRYKEIS
ncbi:hypothetical protein V6N13_037309 [Hibiscus sabdariffa]